MSLALAGLGVAVLSVLVVVWAKSTKDRNKLEQHSVTPETLYSLLASNQELLVLDVRQPLDLLAYPEMIPGARRIAPADVLETPSLIPKEKDAVVYCTCPGDKTSRAVLNRALEMQFVRVKFLRGGLAAWKAQGYPVEPYKEVFNLYAPTPAPSR